MTCVSTTDHPIDPNTVLRRCRPSWDTYFMRLAAVVAQRGTCDRKLVGALLVLERRILATGYNGAPAGSPSCDDLGKHELVDINGRPSCVRTIHAEDNAIIQCALHGVAARGATVYVTAMPCIDCAKRIIQLRASRVVYGEPYSSARSGNLDIPKMFADAGIEAVELVTSL